MRRTSSFPALAVVALLGGCGAPATSAQTSASPSQAADRQTMTLVHIDTPGHRWTARLNGSRAARDFADSLPLKLTLTDYAATEKIADLPSKLGRDGAPASPTPRAGDIAYYAPWGNLAIYHKDFRASPGLIILGHIDGDASGFARPGPIEVTITRADAAAPERSR